MAQSKVERRFATLTEKYIRRGTHRSTRQFEQALQQCLDIHNANPKPFVWAKPADDILFRREFEANFTKNCQRRRRSDF